jgi:hypothetical protein
MNHRHNPYKLNFFEKILYNLLTRRLDQIMATFDETKAAVDALGPKVDAVKAVVDALKNTLPPPVVGATPEELDQIVASAAAVSAGLDAITAA